MGYASLYQNIVMYKTETQIISFTLKTQWCSHLLFGASLHILGFVPPGLLLSPIFINNIVCYMQVVVFYLLASL